jgi:hypothetical protein
MEIALEPRRDLSPGAVRFREAMEEDDRRFRSVTGDSDVERYAGPERNAPELGHG